MKTLKVSLFAMSLLASGSALAQSSASVDNLSPAGRELYNMYTLLAAPKAFAVANDGAVGYFAGATSEDQARTEALSRCSSMAANGGCEIVSLNGQAQGAAQSALGALAEAHADADEQLAEVRADYGKATGNKALAMSNDGAWGWTSGMQSAEQAQQEALRQCQAYGQNCTIAESNTASR